MGVALESAEPQHQIVQLSLPDMAEGGVPDVVGQPQGLRQLGIDEIILPQNSLLTRRYSQIARPIRATSIEWVNRVR